MNDTSVTTEAREELATLIDEASDEFGGPLNTGRLAEALLAQGYVRVIEDGATVARVADALYDHLGCSLKQETAAGCAACRSDAEGEARVAIRAIKAGAS